MKGSHAEALRRKDQKQELPGLLCDFGDFASLRETVSALSPKYLANSRELRVWRFVNLSVLATLQLAFAVHLIQERRWRESSDMFRKGATKMGATAIASGSGCRPTDPSRAITALLLLSLASFTSALRAQSTNASLTGRVTDPSKAVIVDAKVAAIRATTNVRYQTTTYGSGEYYLANLPPRFLSYRNRKARLQETNQACCDPSRAGCS
jgi:hypothetical protein